MNILSKPFFTVLFVCTMAFSYAQSVPGYLGKRFSIGYTVRLTPNFRTGNFSTSEPGDELTSNNDFFENEGILAFDLKGVSNQHYITAEYVLTKKISLVGEVGFSRAYYTPPSVLSFFREISYDERPSVNMLAFSVGSRFYRNQLAPVGNFVEPYIGFQLLTMGDFTYDVEYQDQQTGIVVNETHTITPGNGGNFIGGIKFGRSRIIADKIKIDFFGSIGYQSTGLFSSFTFFSLEGDVYDAPINDGFREGNSRENQEVFNDFATGRLWGSHWATTGISISFLP